MILASIETDRLMLRPLRVGDADEMATVLADHSLYVFTGGEPPTAIELTSRYRQQTEGSGVPGEVWCNWIIGAGSTGRAVGFVQATVVGEVADLAWVVGVADQGNGFATESVIAVRDRLEAHHVRRVEAHVHPQHGASQAVAHRVGMLRTGERDDENEEIWAADLPIAPRSSGQPTR